MFKTSRSVAPWLTERLEEANLSLASSRHSVSHDAAQKTSAGEKNKKKRGERKRAVFCVAPWVTKRLEGANERCFSSW